MALSTFARAALTFGVVTGSLLASALSGCASARTEVIVSVDSDVAGLDSIVIDVTDPRGTTRSSTATLSASDAPLPRTLGVVWTAGELGPFVVRAAGSAGGIQRVSRVADFTFQRGRTLVLHLDLLERCAAVVCAGGETCGDSGCRSTTIDPSELVPYTPDAITGVDGGMRGDGSSCGPEVDFATDEANCGTCGHACNFANGDGMCQAGTCLITRCDDGFGDCNGRENDGCESDTETDTDNCGRCGTDCRGFNDMCCAGTCDNSC